MQITDGFRAPLSRFHASSLFNSSRDCPRGIVPCSYSISGYGGVKYLLYSVVISQQSTVDDLPCNKPAGSSCGKILKTSDEMHARNWQSSIAAIESDFLRNELVNSPIAV